MVYAVGTDREYAAASALLERIAWVSEGHLDPTRNAIAWDPIIARRPLLSSGEKVILDVAWALWSGSDGLHANVADLLRLDAESFAVVLDAIQFRKGAAA